MSHLIRLIKINPSRAARRFVKGRRRGSVLILCVVLIVVLALIGTAMISGARIDRAATQQYGANTAIDFLVDGTRQMAEGVVVNDTFDLQTRQFRKPTDQAQLNPTSTYDHTDGYYIPPATVTTLPPAEDSWLAPLLPEQVAAGAPPYWSAISAPLTGAVFESPFFGPGTPLEGRTYMFPVSQNVTYPDGTVQKLPALRFLEPTTSTVVTHVAGDADGDGIADCMLSRLLPGELNGITWYVGLRAVDNAAKVNVNTALSQERDYDGTGSEITGAQFTKFFTGAVGLSEMLRGRAPGTSAQLAIAPTINTDFGRLNEFRFNTVPGDELPHGIAGGAGDPRDDAGTARTDFDYWSVGDALYTGLGRRSPTLLGGPGKVRGSGLGAALPWEAFTMSEDMVALVSRFTLINPEASKSKIETMLDDSVYKYAVNGQSGSRTGIRLYTPDQAPEWHRENFNFEPQFFGATIPNLDPTLFMPLRSLLATHNGVSNWMPQHAMTYPPLGLTGAPSTELYPRGIRPALKTPDVNNHLLMPDYDNGAMARSVAKANVNTAKFGELWRAYWNVMVDQTTPVNYAPTFNGGTPFESPLGYDLATNLYSGNEFGSLDGVPTPASEHPQHMFRPSLRDHRADFMRAVYFPPYQQLLLRAAIAAANTEDLRDTNNDVNDDPLTPSVNESDEQPSRRVISLVAMVNGAATNVGVEVYGIEPQPYITEVYVNTQKDFTNEGIPAPNPKGYVAIELYNPYPRPIDISGWIMAVIDRRPNPDTANPHPVNPYPNPTGGVGLKGLSYFYIHPGPESTLPTASPGVGTPTPYDFPDGTTIPAYGYLVLDNHSLGAAAPTVDAANHFPMTAGQPANRIYVPNLHRVIQDLDTGFKECRGGEFVLLRPVFSALPPALDPPGIENGNVMPIDSFDFTSLLSEELWVSRGVDQDTSWHYVRSNHAMPAGGQTINDTPNWKFVYPGRYHGLGEAYQQRHQGTAEQPWTIGSLPGDPQKGNPLLGEAGPAAVTGMFQNRHTIQLAALGFPGPHVPTVAGPNRAPFGGFVRNGDILQVTYIGAYRVFFIGDPSSTLELNSVTIDACFANDTDAGALALDNNDELPGALANDPDPTTPWMDTREQVGRFVPLRIKDAAGVDRYNDYETGTFNGGTVLPGVNRWRYRWAIDLFDYLTVQSPGNDYLPDVPTDDLANGGTAYVPTRLPVDNDADNTFGDVDANPPTATNARGLEDHVPVHGLININTAPAKVLAAIPWMPIGDQWTYTATSPIGTRWTFAPDQIEDNYQLAKEIVLWRDGSPTVTANGPFNSPMDLYRVPAFWELQDGSAGMLFQTNVAGGPDDAEGDFSPHNNPLPPTPPPTLPLQRDAVRFDFEEQFMLLNRVSNLITTRSDSFTVYLTVQGWINAGTRNAQLVAQRRVGFIIDRSKVQVNAGKPETKVETQHFGE